MQENTKEESRKKIGATQEIFAKKSGALISDLQSRMNEGKKQILSYSNDIGASLNGAKPNFEGDFAEVELYYALRPIIEHEYGMKIPATRNGLSYNNLILMSLLLAKMQINSDGDYLGGDAKNFSVLAIGEPEAHLHPSMQSKFL